MSLNELADILDVDDLGVPAQNLMFDNFGG